MLGDKEISLEKLNLLLLAFIAGVIPMIVRFQQVELSQATEAVWINLVNTDFFSFYKMVWLLLLSVILLVLFAIYIRKKGYIKTYYYIPLFIYGIFVIISTIRADFQLVALRGFPDRFEGFFVLMAYILLTVVAINLTRSFSSAKIILGGIVISATILGIQGVLQFFGYDLFQTALGARIILPADMVDMAERMDFRFGERRVYSTMFNPNYVGSYGAMLVVFLLGFYINLKDRWKVVLAGLLSSLMFAFMVGSKSRAGMVGFMAGCLLLGLIMRFEIWRKWQRVLIIGIIFFIIFLGMDAYSLDDIWSEITSPETEPDLIEDVLEEPALTDIKTDSNRLTIETEAGEVNLVLREDYMDFYDQSGESIDLIVDEETGEVSLNEEGFRDHRFELFPEERIIIWNYDGNEAVFNTVDGEFYIMGMGDRFFEIRDVPTFGFEGRERLGSSRGYIWSRSIPLLSDTLLYGHGPDTYAMYFPQEDIVGKLMFLSSAQRVVDKPHNLFLQIGINTGVVSLLALLVLWGIYIIESIMIYWKADYNNLLVISGIAIMAAVGAYLVTGIFNDSVISVAPVLWVLLGTGIGVNRLVKP